MASEEKGWYGWYCAEQLRKCFIYPIAEYQWLNGIIGAVHSIGLLPAYFRPLIVKLSPFNSILTGIISFFYTRVSISTAGSSDSTVVRAMNLLLLFFFDITY